MISVGLDDHALEERDDARPGDGEVEEVERNQEDQNSQMNRTQDDVPGSPGAAPDPAVPFTASGLGLIRCLLDGLRVQLFANDHSNAFI